MVLCPAASMISRVVAPSHGQPGTERVAQPMPGQARNLRLGDRWLEPGASVEPLQLAIDDVLPLLPWEDAASPSVISVGVR